MSDFRKTYGHFSHRPLAEQIAELGGLRLREPGIADSVERIDPLELVRQRAARDFASTLLSLMGWSLDLKPPAAEEKPRQEMAESDGVQHGRD